MKQKLSFASYIFIITTCWVALDFVCPESVFAYIDPGAGSTLTQTIVAIVAGVQRFFSKITAFFCKIFARNKD